MYIIDITTQRMEFTGESSERPRMIRRNTWTKLEGDILVKINKILKQYFSKIIN